MILSALGGVKFSHMPVSSCEITIPPEIFCSILINLFDVRARVSNHAYMLYKSLGERLAELRHEAGLSLRELGEKVGASAPHVRDVEVGNRQPSEALVEKMAAALGSDLDDLLKYSTRPPSRQMEELIEQDNQYSLAFRKFVDAVREKNIQPSEILDLTENLPNKKDEP